VYSYTTMFAEAGVCAVYAGTTPARADEVLSLIRDELASLATEGLTREEFSRAKSHMKGSLVLSLEDPGGRMSRLGKSEISHGEVLTMDQILKRLDAVTLEDTRRAAARVFSQPLALTVLGPFGARAFAGSGAPVAAHHGGRR
jgi:predicted Zn-dependent peptidase